VTLLPATLLESQNSSEVSRQISPEQLNVEILALAEKRKIERIGEKKKDFHPEWSDEVWVSTRRAANIWCGRNAWVGNTPYSSTRLVAYHHYRYQRNSSLYFMNEILYLQC